MKFENPIDVCNSMLKLQDQVLKVGDSFDILIDTTKIPNIMGEKALSDLAHLIRTNIANKKIVAASTTSDGKLITTGHQIENGKQTIDVYNGDKSKALAALWKEFSLWREGSSKVDAITPQICTVILGEMTALMLDDYISSLLVGIVKPSNRRPPSQFTVLIMAGQRLGLIKIVLHDKGFTPEPINEPINVEDLFVE